MPNAKDRWGEKVVVIVLGISGTALFLFSTFFNGLVGVALSSIGLSLLGSAAAAGVILALVGSDVGGLKREVSNLEQEVDKLHVLIEEEVNTIHKSVASFSVFIHNAYGLGIVGIGRARASPNYEGRKNFVERWKYLLENANEVDILCFADTVLFSSEVFNPFFIDKIRGRMNQQEEAKRLKLRIILSSLNNPHLKEINVWSGMPQHLESRIYQARFVLNKLCGGTLSQEVIKEHKAIVPFTLLRGDNYLYIVFFIPGHEAGPILEIRPHDMISYSRVENIEVEDEKKLFKIYLSYFEDMWNNRCDPITSHDQ